MNRTHLGVQKFASDSGVRQFIPSDMSRTQETQPDDARDWPTRHLGVVFTHGTNTIGNGVFHELTVRTEEACRDRGGAAAVQHAELGGPLNLLNAIPRSPPIPCPRQGALVSHDDQRGHRRDQEQYLRVETFSQRARYLGCADPTRSCFIACRPASTACNRNSTWRRPGRCRGSAFTVMAGARDWRKHGRAGATLVSHGTAPAHTKR